MFSLSLHGFIVPAFDNSCYLWTDMIHVPDSISRIRVVHGEFLLLFLFVCLFVSSRQCFFFIDLVGLELKQFVRLSLPSAGIK